MLNLLSKDRQVIDYHRNECRSNFADNDVDLSPCQLALLMLLSLKPDTRTYIAAFAPKVTLYTLCEKGLIDKNIHLTALGDDMLRRIGKK